MSLVNYDELSTKQNLELIDIVYLAGINSPGEKTDELLAEKFKKISNRNFKKAKKWLQERVNK